jgi:hypothetical protein
VPNKWSGLRAPSPLGTSDQQFPFKWLTIWAKIDDLFDKSHWLGNAEFWGVIALIRAGSSFVFGSHLRGQG